MHAAMDQLLEYITKERKPDDIGVVYCLTRKVMKMRHLPNVGDRLGANVAHGCVPDVSRSSLSFFRCATHRTPSAWVTF